MPRFRVTAEWDGSATIVVEAEDEHDAEDVAKGHWCGFNVAGGFVDYDIEECEQVDDAEPVTQ